MEVTGHWGIRKGAWTRAACIALKSVPFLLSCFHRSEDSSEEGQLSSTSSIRIWRGQVSLWDVGSSSFLDVPLKPHSIIQFLNRPSETGTYLINIRGRQITILNFSAWWTFHHRLILFAISYFLKRQNLVDVLWRRIRNSKIYLGRLGGNCRECGMGQLISSFCYNL